MGRGSSASRFSHLRFRFYRDDLVRAILLLSEEIRMADIHNAWINADDATEKPMQTIGDKLKAARAQIAAARAGATKAADECDAASKLVVEETQKALKEAADLRAEVAGLNGGPPL